MILKIQENYNSEKKCWDINVAGELDISTAQNLRDVLKCRYQEQKADFNLDLSDLNYMDSTGLGVIIGAFGRMKEEGYKISVQNPKENVAKLLRITNLDKILVA